MRRSAIAAFLAGVAFVPAALAAPSPQLYDPAGDAALQSQDIVSGRLSSFWSGRTPRLRGELKLVAAPADHVVSGYNFMFHIGCKTYGFHYDWRGATGQAAAELHLRDYCKQRAQTDLGVEPDRAFPVTFTLKGTTLTWESAYAGGIARGQRVQGFAATACNGVCAVFGGQAGEVWAGDGAWNDRTYVVGSDLPRR